MAEQKTSIYAILSLVFSILGLIIRFWGILSILAIVFAILARKEISRNPNIKGKGLALAGLIIGIIVLVLILLYALFGLSMAVMKKALSESENDLDVIQADIEKQVIEDCCSLCTDENKIKNISNKETFLCKDLDILEGCKDFLGNRTYTITDCEEYLK